MQKLKPILPKEHGIWIWALLPTIVGWYSVVKPNNQSILFFFVVLFWLLAFTPARILYKESKKGDKYSTRVIVWSLIFTSLGIGFSVWSILVEPFILLVLVFYAPFFYIAIKASHAGFQRNFLLEFGGLTLLSFLSLASAFFARGQIVYTDFAVWTFLIIFLLERSLQARHCARGVEWKRETPPSVESLRLLFKINLFIAFSALIAGSVVLNIFKLKNIFLVIYAPGFLTTSRFYLRPPRNLRVIGWSELFVAVLFGCLLIKFSPHLYG